MTRDEINVLHNHTIDRLHKNGIDVTNSVDIVVALQNEIIIYREKITRLENDVNYRASEIKREREISSDLRKKMLERERQYCEIKKTLDAQPQSTTAGEIIKALADNGYNTITINCYKTEREE